MTNDVIVLCPSCDSPHFNIRWSEQRQRWQAACEGCGSLYELNPAGSVQMFMRGTDQH